LNLHYLLAGTLLASAIATANPYESNQEELASVIATGKKSSLLLLKTLGSNLQKHMKSEGPMGAAQFCVTNAYPLTDQVSSELGKDVTVKRISLKYRNPANKPTAGEEAVMHSLQTLQDNHVILPEYLVERVNAETYKFYKPLNINKDVCLKCHGNISSNPKLEAYIGKNYPEDKATGYKMGDLRGAIIVTIRK
jgi:hypothetical protein